MGLKVAVGMGEALVTSGAVGRCRKTGTATSNTHSAAISAGFQAARGCALRRAAALSVRRISASSACTAS